MAQVVYYPAFLNLKDKLVLLFGGGDVALRKAHSLQKSGARLKVISREFSDRFIQFARRNRIKLRRATAIPISLKGIFLVIAASSDWKFNQEIFRRCTRAGVLVNVVDDPEHSSFIVPSVLRRGRLQIAISTGGASPYLAKLLRQKLSAQLGSPFEQLVEKLARDRQKAKRLMRSGKVRKNHFRSLVRSRLKDLEVPPHPSLSPFRGRGLR